MWVIPVMDQFHARAFRGPVDEREEGRGGVDRVAPVRRPPGMCGDAGDLDLEVCIPAARDHGLQIGRLGHDAAAELMPQPARGQVTDPEAQVLFIHGGRQPHGPGELRTRTAQRIHRDEYRRQPALHVRGTAAVQPIALDLRVVRLPCPPGSGGHHIGVAQEQQPRPVRHGAAHGHVHVHIGSPRGDDVAAGQ